MNSKHALFVVFLLPLTGLADTNVIYRLDPAQTQVSVLLGKTGLFGFMGDNHVIDVPVSEGTLVFDPSTNKFLSLEFILDTGRIKVLDPNIKEETRDVVQEKMVGEKVLDVSKYPTIRFFSTAFNKSNQGNSWRIPGNMTVKDKTVSVEITAEIQIESSGFTAKGQAELKLSDFGITPPGAGAGTIKVKNLFDVEFESHGQK